MLVAAIVAVVLVLLGWGAAAAGGALLVEGVIAVVLIGINSILQKMFGVGDEAQITVSFIELMVAFFCLSLRSSLPRKFLLLQPSAQLRVQWLGCYGIFLLGVLCYGEIFY